MTGEQLYHQWCGSSTTDTARYWHVMNPADQRRWERLADWVEVELDVGLAQQFAPARLLLGCARDHIVVVGVVARRCHQLWLVDHMQA